MTLGGSRTLARLEKTGVLVLDTSGSGGAQTAVVLADGDQLADLARLGFRPHAADELGLLVSVQGAEKRWLVESLQPLLAQAAMVVRQRAITEQQATADVAGADDAAAAGAAEVADALAVRALRTSLQALTPEQIAGTADSVSVDDDADGLTNTQEAWWCTDPLDADTDDDGRLDGAEIQALKDWLGNRRESAPGETPWPAWPMSPTSLTCPDKDSDSIPNLAERWELGLNMDLESSDRDRYDDGQELFGTTYCPGSASACGYGQLPSANHDGILLFPQMPSWVTAPGDHPLVAALPRLNFSVIPDAEGAMFRLQTATVVTTDERHEEGETKSYSTTKTDGTSTSDAETETWENWQEYSKTTEAASQAVVASSLTPSDTIINSTEQRLQVTNVRMNSTTNNTMKVKINNEYYQNGGSNPLKDISAPVTSFVVDEACAELGCRKYLGSGIKATVRTVADVIGGTIFGTSDKIQDEFQANNCDPTSFDPSQIWCRVKSAGTLWNKNYDERLAAATTAEQQANGLVGGNYLQTDPTALNITRVYPITFPEPRFIPTETTTTGSSTGGARTTTHTTYEEHSVTEGTAQQFGRSWGTATAQDSLHAADLWFAYSIGNAGTDYARQICDLAINIYIGNGNAPAATYFPGVDIGGDGCFSNFRPGESHNFTFATGSRIALTLNEMAAIDQGEQVRFVIEDYSLGQDDFYADDAIGADVQLGIEDGSDDLDEEVENSLTWAGRCSTFSRYFPTRLMKWANVDLDPEQRRTPACIEPVRTGTSGNRALLDWWLSRTAGRWVGRATRRARADRSSATRIPTSMARDRAKARTDAECRLSSAG